MWHTGLVYLGEVIGAILGSVAIVRLVFPTKTEVSNMLKEHEKEAETNLEKLEKELDQRSLQADDKIEQRLQKTEDDLYKAVELVSMKVEKGHLEFKEELSGTKEIIYEKLLEAERANNNTKQEIYDKLNQNKQIFEDYNKQILETISQIKQDQKETTNSIMMLINTIKDELRNDSINRYNELLSLVNTKVSQDDFDRLENKFDKLIENVAELKAIVNTRFDNYDKRK